MGDRTAIQSRRGDTILPRPDESPLQGLLVTFASFPVARATDKGCAGPPALHREKQSSQRTQILIRTSPAVIQ